MDVARLGSGDFLVKLVHPQNVFSLSSLFLDELMGVNIQPGQLVFVPKENVVKHTPSEIFHIDRNLPKAEHRLIPVSMRWYIYARIPLVEIRTNLIPLVFYTDTRFMNDLYTVFCTHSERKRLVKKYSHLGPLHIPYALFEARVKMIDPPKLSRTCEIV